MDALRLGDAAALELFASIYLGTGFTIVFYLGPLQPRLNPATYKLPFVEPVRLATRTFTVMTSLMLAGSAGLIALEAGTRYWILPAIYLAATIAATLLTTRIMFPINNRMSEGVETQEELQPLLTRWRRFNTIRFSLWGVEWVAITTWFVSRAA